MALDKLTCTRETAERLKAAGFPQTTELCHYEMTVSVTEEVDGCEVTRGTRTATGVREAHRVYKDDLICAAPTLSEILAELPCFVTDGDYDYDLRSWPVGYMDENPVQKIGFRRWPGGFYPNGVLPEPLTPEGAARIWLALHAGGLLRAEVPA